jgi:uncharacterized membrane protein YbhN (UPF0104 family)
MSKHLRIWGSVFLLGLLAWRLEHDQLLQAFSGLNLHYWLLAGAVYIVAQVVSSLRWQLLSAPLGFVEPWWSYLSFYFIGMFFNLLLPTSVGGDVVRALYLSAGQPRRSQAVLSVLADRGTGLAVLVAVACTAGIFVPLPGWMRGILIALAVGMLLGVACLPALPLVRRLPFVGARLGRLVESARIYLDRPGLLAVSTLLSIVVQLAGILQGWLIARGLGLNVPLGYMAVVVPLVALLTLIPISVSGMGLREFGMILLLAPLGVTSAAAVTLSLLTFASCASISLVGGALYFFGRFPRAQACAPDEPTFATTAVEGQSNAQPFGRDTDQGRTGESRTAA